MNNNKSKTSNENTKNKKNGFTLIELLVVVLIIGILAAIALPMYQTAVAKSKISTLMQLTKSIKDAQERYYLVNDAYTSDFNNLDLDMPIRSSGYVVYDNITCIIYFWYPSVIACFLPKTKGGTNPYNSYAVYRMGYDKNTNEYIALKECLVPVGDTAYNKACGKITGSATFYKTSNGYNFYRWR